MFDLNIKGRKEREILNSQVLVRLHSRIYICAIRFLLQTKKTKHRIL
jgi:hypothetical protein